VITYNFVHVAMVFCIGWTNEFKDGKLSIYQVKVFEHGPEVALSLTIEKKFSWLVVFRR